MNKASFYCTQHMGINFQFHYNVSSGVNRPLCLTDLTVKNNLDILVSNLKEGYENFKSNFWKRHTRDISLNRHSFQWIAYI